ncbi:hypothetical protein [Parafrankia sp. EUN1f]|uniref:hypothetical protein n=1 Tax=Parafrankia sp. EUN1f TaxID=102897 RepID=UPI0012FC93EF|nr:hypothetical protein [Parafrankia sp. EUN1f]
MPIEIGSRILWSGGYYPSPRLGKVIGIKGGRISAQADVAGDERNPGRTNGLFPFRVTVIDRLPGETD